MSFDSNTECKMLPLINFKGPDDRTTADDAGIYITPEYTVNFQEHEKQLDAATLAVTDVWFKRVCRVNGKLTLNFNKLLPILSIYSL